MTTGTLLSFMLATLALATPASASVNITPTDLGTLGGGSSFGYGIDDLGYVVGKSGTRIQESHAFLWRSETEGMIDLGTLGGRSSAAVSINDRGEVAGWSETASGETRAFVWTEARGMVDLGTLGGDRSWPVAINAQGKVVGWSRLADGTAHAFLVEPLDLFGDGVPDVWYRDLDGDGINDLMRDLGTLGGATSTPEAIDDAGDVVGHATTAAGERHPFLWTPTAGMVDLGTLGGTWGEAYGVAGRRVVGASTTASGETHAFVWTETDGMQQLDLGGIGNPTFSQVGHVTPGGAMLGHAGADRRHANAFYVEPVNVGPLGTVHMVGWIPTTDPELRALDLADGLRVTGWMGDSSPGPSHARRAFVWRANGGLIDLHAHFVDPDESEGVAVNAQGMVAGWVSYATSLETHAFAFYPALPGVIDLGTLGGDTSRAADINGSGWVVGYSNTPPDETHAFWWTPAGGMVDLGTLPGATASEARAVADTFPFIVGESGGHGFLWWPTMAVAGTWRVLVGSIPYPLTLHQTGNTLSLTGSSGALTGHITGRDVVLRGTTYLASNLRLTRADVQVAADGASAALLNSGLIPHIVVTDLDGGDETLLKASRLNAVMAVHAHGDTCSLSQGSGEL